MFTKKVNSTEGKAERPTERRRGRPQGTTSQGLQARQRLYGTAIRMIGERGYAATTMRDIADAAGVSVGLLYGLTTVGFGLAVGWLATVVFRRD